MANCHCGPLAHADASNSTKIPISHIFRNTTTDSSFHISKMRSRKLYLLRLKIKNSNKVLSCCIIFVKSCIFLYQTTYLFVNVVHKYFHCSNIDLFS